VYAFEGLKPTVFLVEALGMDQMVVREIECLACGDVREVQGNHPQETGECPRCGYVGWSYVADLDLATQEMIVSGLLARRGRTAPRSRSPRRVACGWQMRRELHSDRPGTTGLI
jgi:hypothetical protein